LKVNTGCTRQIDPKFVSQIYEYVSILGLKIVTFEFRELCNLCLYIYIYNECLLYWKGVYSVYMYIYSIYIRSQKQYRTRKYLVTCQTYSRVSTAPLQVSTYDFVSVFYKFNQRDCLDFRPETKSGRLIRYVDNQYKYTIYIFR